jgi:hypothetical protein
LESSSSNCAALDALLQKQPAVLVLAAQFQLDSNSVELESDEEANVFDDTTFDRQHVFDNDGNELFFSAGVDVLAANAAQHRKDVEIQLDLLEEGLDEDTCLAALDAFGKTFPSCF